MKVLVINVGDVEYGKYTLPKIKKLCDFSEVELIVLDTDLSYNKYKLHPSWLKLFCHDIIEDDFIVCWDLDLIPTKMYNLPSIFNINKLNLVQDIGNKYGHTSFNHKFKYNCGLMGIPKHFREDLNNIYNIFGRNASYPSYEQYYINDYIYDNKVEVNELDEVYNYLVNPYHINDNIHNLHVTWTVPNERKLDFIRDMNNEI